jgi:hypothetical protein
VYVVLRIHKARPVIMSAKLISWSQSSMTSMTYRSFFTARAGGLQTEQAVILAGTSLSFIGIFDLLRYRQVAVWYLVPVLVT